MITSNSMPITSVGRDQSSAIPTPELIDRMAAELRATGDRDLPHSFYVEQVKRRLANEAAANDDRAEAKRADPSTPPSVFHSWALSERA